MKKLQQNQQGLAHVVMVCLILIVVATIGFVGWKVVSGRKKTSTTTVTSKTGTAATTSTSSNSAAATAKKPATTTTTTTSKTPVTAISTPTSAPAASAPATPPAVVGVTPAGYTNLGTISASNLYNVKTPPPASEQPTVTLFACYKSTGASTGYVQFLGEMSYPVPQDAGSAWYTNLDLSSSASANNIISDKSSTQSYFNNAWHANSVATGMVNEGGTITTSAINPGVVTDYYVWASASYGGSTWQTINFHPNVTQLASCN